MTYNLEHYVKQLLELQSKSKNEEEFLLKVATALKTVDDTLLRVNQLRSEEAERAANVKRELLKGWRS